MVSLVKGIKFESEIKICTSFEFYMYCFERAHTIENENTSENVNAFVNCSYIWFERSLSFVFNC